MSGFKLDVDFPVEISAPDKYTATPEKVPYPGRHIRYRHYGKDVELIIDQVLQMPEGPERDELVLLLANHMIHQDLAEYSHGMIRLDPETTSLHEFKIVAPPATGKKKRKR